MKKLKRNYLKINSQLTSSIKKQDMKQVKILFPKWLKMQNALSDLGLNYVGEYRIN